MSEYLHNVVQDCVRVPRTIPQKQMSEYLHTSIKDSVHIPASPNGPVRIPADSSYNLY